MMSAAHDAQKRATDDRTILDRLRALFARLPREKTIKRKQRGRQYLSEQWLTEQLYDRSGE